MNITIVNSNREFNTVELDETREYTMGRSPECSVMVKSTIASRLHARLFFRDGSWRVSDNQSTNGTWLNGKKIRECAIANYDVVRIGDVLVEFNDEELLQSIIINKSEISGYTNEKAAAQNFVLNEFSVKVGELLKDFNEKTNERNFREETARFQTRLTEMVNSYASDNARINSEMKILFELTKSISEILNLKQLLNIALDLVHQIKKVDRGLVLLYEKKSDRFVPYVARRMSLSDLKVDENLVSKSILAYMKNNPGPVLIKNSLMDERFASAESVVALSAKSILCIPLVSQQGLQGSFYLEKDAAQPFDEADSEFLKNFASAVSVAIENTKLIMAIKRERSIRNNMERYLSPNLIDQLTQTSGELKLDGEKREISVMFADIKNFTKMSEQLKVEEVFSMLNKTFSEITQIIFKHDGTLDKFIGDAVMAFFGAPMKHDDDPVRSVMTAVEIIETVKRMADEYRSEFGVEVSFSIGINTGEAIVGNVGSLDRMEYTAIGDTVNLAARLQAKAGYNEIVINESVYNLVKDRFGCEPLPPFFVKGKEQAIKAYLIKI
jgi:adenylate cyclase